MIRARAMDDWRVTILLGWATFVPILLHAQLLDQLLITAGTTIHHPRHGDVAVLVWDETSADTIRGKVFAVDVRPGGAGLDRRFTRTAVLPSVDPATIAGRLALASDLGMPVEALQEAISALAGPSTDPLATRISALVRRAANDIATDRSVAVLSRSHLGFALATGRAWAGSVPPGVSSIELRELNPATGVDLAVVGRITVDSARETALPAPGRPFQPLIAGVAPLSIPLRWSTPTDLRRRTPLQRGFNLWRMPRAEAAARGWLSVAPGLEPLRAAASQVNPAPIHPPVLLNESEATSPSRDEVFYIDRDPGGPVSWRDGDEFAYFATARDILGRDGQPSPAGVARACDTSVPPTPAPPSIARQHTFAISEGGLDRQWLRLQWPEAQGVDAAGVARFEVFRGTDLADFQRQGGPPPALKIGVVAAGASQNVFDDRTLVPEPAFQGRSFWYSVRSVRETACGPVVSGFSPPVTASLGSFAGPPAATGEILTACPFPAMAWITNGLEAASAPVDPSRESHRLECRRRGRGILWAEFHLRLNRSGRERPLGRYWFPAEDDVVRVPFELTAAEAAELFEIQARAGSAEGTASSTTIRGPQPGFRPRPGTVAVDVFEAAERSTWDLDPDDPLSRDAFSESGCFETLSVDAGGTVTVRTAVPDGAMVVVVARPDPNNAPAAPSRPMGAAIVRGGVLVLHDAAAAGRDARALAWRYCGYRVNPNLDRRGCPHLARPDGVEHVHPVRIRLDLGPTVRQYRIYRRMDDGPLELIVQGAADGSKFPAVARDDDSLPPRSATLCYFGQWLDENGNAGPISPLGCVSLAAPPPVPVLAAPESRGDAANPRMELGWYCPGDGVERFEVFLVSTATGDGGISLGALPIEQRPVTPAAVSEFNAAAYHVLALPGGGTAAVHAAQSFLTGRIGGDLPGGPTFTLPLPVDPRMTYEVWLKAVTPGGRRGQPSFHQRFAWRPPTPPRSQVPWPARPLPPVVLLHPLIRATVDIDCPSDKSEFPVGVRIGALPLVSRTECAGPGEGGIPVAQLPRGASAEVRAGVDPNRWLLGRPDPTRPGQFQSILPAVLYRQQITNSLFPTVGGPVVQVSPRVDRIAWTTIAAVQDFETAVLLDPYVGVRFNGNLIVDGRVGATEMLLLDTQPVVSGARYRYWLVRFDERDEPMMTVPAGDIEIP